MAEPISLSSSVLASFLASNATAINAATGAAAASTAGAVGNALLTQPDKPKTLPTPDPDSKKKRLDTERDIARRYAEQGRVNSLFNKDKLG